VTIKLPNGKILKDGDRVLQDGKAWTVRGNKLVHPIPARLLEGKFVDLWINKMSESINKKLDTKQIKTPRRVQNHDNRI